MDLIDVSIGMVKISPDAKRSKVGTSPDTTPEKAPEEPPGKGEKETKGNKYYFGVYFGDLETKACVFVYNDECKIKQLEYPKPDQISNKKYLPSHVPSQPDMSLEATLASEYSEFVCEFIKKAINDCPHIDAITVVFPSFPHYFDSVMFHSNLCFLLNQYLELDDSKFKEKIYILEERKIWEKLVRYGDCAVYYESGYMFLQKRDDFESTTGIPLEYTKFPNLEELGRKGIEWLVEQRGPRGLGELAFHRLPFLEKAFEIFGANSYDTLMDSVRFRYSVPKMAQLAVAMSEFPELNDLVTRHGRYRLNCALKKTLENVQKDPPYNKLTFIVMGKQINFFEQLAQYFRDDNLQGWNHIQFEKYVKEEMNQPEVACALYGAEKDKNQSTFLERCALIGRRQNRPS